jgi:RimJ/RimL family protein N-acetyltransferase
MTVASLRLVPWSVDDLDLLRRANTPEMTVHLGGPETEERIVARHERYLEPGEPGTGAMFRVALLPGLEPVATIGYWECDWQGETVYETGWAVLPEYQGRGIATVAALAVAELARAEHRHRYLLACPKVTNHASNAICRKAGFTLFGEVDNEYPPGNPIRSNDWRLELT